MSMQHHNLGANGLADVLERVLDKGLVIAGDVSVSLVGVELLTIKLRLVVASVDKARELGIRWWEADPSLNPEAAALPQNIEGYEPPQLAALNDRLARIEAALAATLPADQKAEEVTA